MKRLSHSDYFDHLFKIGCGWLGWTEDQTLDASMWAIEAAHDGRLDMLKMCFGSGAEETSGAPASPENIKNLFRSMKKVSP